MTRSVASSLSLPALPAVLGLPGAIGGVPASTLLGVFGRANSDIPKLIAAVKAHHWRDATELTIDDGLYVAGLAGVPGAGLAATFAPYAFDMLNAEIDSHGHVTVGALVQELTHANSNVGLIVADLAKRDYYDAAQLELNDLLDVANAFGAGPFAAFGRVLVNVGFGIAKSDATPAAFNALFAGVEQFGHDLASLPEDIYKMVVDGELPPIAGHPGWCWDPLQGPVYKGVLA